MKLKGKQSKDFVKALNKSEKINKKLKTPFQAYDSMGVKEIKAVYGDPIKPIISVADDVELEKLKEILQKQSAVKCNPKLVKECIVTTEWIKEDESVKEKEIFDLAVDIDFAPLSVQLSLEDRRTLANALLKLGYRKINSGENNNE